MKAELSFEGVLTVTAETGVEEYALSKWWADYCEKSPKATLSIEWRDLASKEKDS